MRVYYCFLFLVGCIFLSVEQAWADAVCLKPAVVVDKPVELRVQQVQGQDGRYMISGSWHETFMPNFINCTGLDSTTPIAYYLAPLSTPFLPPAYVFEGVRYGVVPTTNPDVGLIYSTSVSGEGYKGFYFSGDSGFFRLDAGSDGTIKRGISYRYRFIALKRLPAGRLVVSDPNLKSAMVWSFNTTSGVPSGSNYVSYRFYGPASVTITVNNTSCSLNAPSTVVLKKANLSLMPSVNSTAEGAAFQLGVSCGASYAPYKVLYSMSDVRTPDNNTSMLTLASGAGNASGVSLQVMDGDTPVVFGSASATSASKGLMGAMTTQGGSISKPFNVRYIRTGAQITPGKVSGGVTVTLAYE